MSRLRVFANLRPMGWFGFEAGDYFFEYDPQWRSLPESYALTPVFPLEGQRFTGTSVKFFFKNLLPEGPVLEAIALEKGISLDNLLQFLAELGKDCPGVLSLLPEGQTPADAQQYDPLDLDDLRHRIAQRATRPLIKSRDDASMSLAGAQDKMGVRFDHATGKLWEPVAGSPSTHILKPENRNPEFMPSVINEYLCMRVAKRLKLPVPLVHLLRLPEPVLIIDRYDRAVIDGNIIRQHQIDFCQLMNKDGFFKYERNGNIIGLKDVFAQTGQFLTPGVARLHLVDWVIFNFLIGNADAHAKNLSALVSLKGLELAPFYDLLSVTPYGDERLALYIGYAETFPAVTSVAWEEFCEDCQLSFTEFRKRLAHFAKRVPSAFSDEIKRLENLPDEEGKLVEKIFATVKQHATFAEESLGTK